ncbi:MAG: DUF1598 domain-containing protein [Planctomycetaceae bacterium]|nr:DUF1598 domain-containing protein [Planctomycetaceae bacterium]
MKIRPQSFVFCWLFLCAMTFLFIGSASLFAQEDDPATPPATPATPAAPGVGAAGALTQPTQGGIRIDARGVVARIANQDFGRLTAQQLNAARTAYTLSDDISAKSPMRCISLNRMEKSIIESGGIVTDEMKYLAGIQRITHVFYFPDSKDIVVAGPAEGWFPGYEGAMIGIESLQPVCELQHLITALRAFGPNTEGPGLVTCSIDPTAEGNVRLQQFLSRSIGLNTRRFVEGVSRSLGMQVITVDGIPETTHAAQMMVAADYRMKRIALGLDTLRVPGLQTFIANTAPNAPNALFRWYFVPDYDSVIMTPDRTAMQLVGDAVRLIGENELVSETGERSTMGGELDPGSRAFTESFTEHYPQIARQALVFAQLRNWIDMLICAAHIHQEDFYARSGWSMEFFGCEEKFPLETFTAAREVAPVVATRSVGRLTVAPVGGGIEIQAELALSDEHAQPDRDGNVAEQRNQISLNLPEGVWWWDVK